MSHIFKVVATLLALVAFSAVANAEGDVKKGKKVFKKCKICHDVGEKAKSKVGPILNDIIGKPAGAQDGFTYSKPMKEAGAKGLVWTEEKLSEFLKKPKKFMPGTKMTFAGIKKEKDMTNLIAYLKTFTKKAE